LCGIYTHKGSTLLDLLRTDKMYSILCDPKLPRFLSSCLGLRLQQLLLASHDWDLISLPAEKYVDALCHVSPSTGWPLHCIQRQCMPQFHDRM
jgi:hypothetical protein